MFRSVLAAVDLSASSTRVARRAALLPLAPDAAVTLLHVVPRMSTRLRRSTEVGARRMLEGVARDAATAPGHQVRVRSVLGTGNAAREIVSHARSLGAELIVLGRAGGRPLRDAFLGSTAERVLRHGRFPVLVVRRPAAAPYRRPVLALDTDEASGPALALALRLLPPPRPQLALVHAYEVRSADEPYPALLTPAEEDAFRLAARREATGRLAQLMAMAHVAAKGMDLRWAPSVQYGSPRTVIPKFVAKHRADLLVLGGHGRSGVTQVFIGSVAGDVLRSVSCDVLVVPPEAGGARAPRPGRRRRGS